MPRKVIIGVIGATHRRDNPVPPEVLDLACSIGREIGTRDAILLTGGEPSEKDRSVKSFAMLGCQQAIQDERPSGRMISVLPEPKLLPPDHLPCVDPVPGTRRIVLRTKLSSMGRNPITGGTPDRLIVLPGGVGTLVEVAFALRWDDAAPVFARPVEHLRWENAHQQRQTKDEILDSICSARTEFRGDGKSGIPDIDPAALRRALSERLNRAQDEAQDTTTIARAAVDAALAGVPAQIVTPTRFEGLPSAGRGRDRLLKNEFEDLVEKLSALQLGAVFQ
jgi:predicted Rossmann-fold nucleotide-binding protein